MRKLKIPVLTADALTPRAEAALLAAPEADPFAGDDMLHQYFGLSGRWLLSAVLASLGLTRGDEIAILTTSGETYVSTCVSVTAFNFARISRAVSPATRAIILIHEFGYVRDGVAGDIEAWRAAGITVVEDCAHIAGFKADNAVVGSMGDFALYSLPKLLPTEAGGILRTRRSIRLPQLSAAEGATVGRAAKAAARLLPKIGWLNARRVENAETIDRYSPDWLVRYRPSRQGLPWLFGLLSDQREAIVATTPQIEWGATLRGDLLYLSTNPLVSPDVYVDLFNAQPFAGAAA